MKKPFITLHIVPTGIGASVGGYAGDATPVTNLMASISDYVITHPNVVNAANLFHPYPNVLYVEGYMLDQFLMGNIDLQLSRGNKTGIVVDKSCEPFTSDIVNAINAVRMTAGVDVTEYIFTDEPIIPQISFSAESGIYNGKIANPQTLLDTCDRLIKNGAEAIAVFTYIDDIPEDADINYQQGKGPDPIGIVEALISRLVSFKFNVPAAHAPVFPISSKREIVYSRAAAEETGFTFIPCVLLGLSKAPLPVRCDNNPFSINRNLISAIVLPYNALGGVASMVGLNSPVIAVKENETILNMDKKVLAIKNLIEVDNYLEAVGLLVSIKEGIKITSR